MFGCRSSSFGLHGIARHCVPLWPSRLERTRKTRYRSINAFAEHVGWFNRRHACGEIGWVSPADFEASYWASRGGASYASGLVLIEPGSRQPSLHEARSASRLSTRISRTYVTRRAGTPGSQPKGSGALEHLDEDSGAVLGRERFTRTRVEDASQPEDIRDLFDLVGLSADGGVESWPQLRERLVPFPPVPNHLDIVIQ